ncbi:hypothetical protein F2P81_020370 [Scophthalmus maximus]|uniref:Uncharacterized protein n=1 Tax=Scophthalmus maximus TaxID=52904 RepID=A0A6A4S514_SCOMX|nr:hypothetical protein F2P81_020370 [Scophthalmus maximus]
MPHIEQRDYTSDGLTELLLPNARGKARGEMCPPQWISAALSGGRRGTCLLNAYELKASQENRYFDRVWRPDGEAAVTALLKQDGVGKKVYPLRTVSTVFNFHFVPLHHISDAKSKLAPSNEYLRSSIERAITNLYGIADLHDSDQRADVPSDSGGAAIRDFDASRAPNTTMAYKYNVKCDSIAGHVVIAAGFPSTERLRKRPFRRNATVCVNISTARGQQVSAN